MTEGRADKSLPAAPSRWKRRLRIAGLSTAVLAALLGAGAVAAWQYRTDVLAWGLRAYLKDEKVTEVALDVVSVEPDHLFIRDVRIVGTRVTTVKSIQAKYSFTGFVAGTLDAVTLTEVRSIGAGLPIEIDTVKGAGRFEHSLLRLDRLTGGLDLVRMRIGPQRFDPSRVDIDLHDNTLVLDTAFTTPDGYVTVLGSGAINTPGTPFRLLLSGRLNAALAAAPVADHVDAQGHVVFSLSAQMNDPFFFLADGPPDALPLPEDLTLDGDIRLALERLRVNGVALPTAEPDRLRFRVESKRRGRTQAAGKFTVDYDVSKRETPEFGFALAEAQLAGNYDYDDRTLTLTLDDGPLLKLREMRLSEGLPVPGDIALQLLGGSNEIDIDLRAGTARHAIDSQLSWKSGELSLKSEGHLTDADDPAIFTLRGALETTPLLALSPATKSASGNANLFFAGRISQPLLLHRAARMPDQAWPGDIRLDGAVKVEFTGLQAPGSVANAESKDSVELTLKGFNGSAGHQSGRLALTGVFDPRQFGGLQVDQTRLTLDGKLSFGTRGYQFVPGIESVLNVTGLRSDAGLVIPNGLNFQLTGADNHITLPSDLSAVYHDITFAHLEADGYMQDEKDKQRPFRITVPKISSRQLEDGKLALYLTGGSFELPADRLAGRGINAALEDAAGGLEFRIEAGEIRHEARPPATTPLAVGAKGVIKGNLLVATLSARQRYGPLKIDGTLKHNLKSHAGRLDFTMPRLAFSEKKPTLEDIFPATAGLFTTARGATSAQGHVLWDKELLSGEMALVLDGVDLATEDVRFAGLSGTVNFIELQPPSMPPRQRLQGTIATGELGPWPMLLEFQLRDDGKIDVQDFDIAMADGVVRTRALIDPAALGTADGSILIRSVDLRELLELLGIDGLNGTGRITGAVPIQVRDGQVTVANGQLKAEGPGTLRYQGTALQEQLAGRPDTVGTVAQVLSDFRYKKLDMELSKAADGAGVIVLHMDGANPKVLDGHPFAFNIKIESDFHKLGYIAQGGLKALTDIMRQLERPSKRE